jgi:signal transduction histidine kinase
MIGVTYPFRVGRMAGDTPNVFEGSSLVAQVLDSIGEGIVISDDQGKFVFFNQVAERMLGIGMTDAAPAQWSERYGAFLPDGTTPFPGDDHPLIRALRGESTDQVEQFVRNPAVPGGIFISITGRPMQDRTTGRITGAIVVVRDVTALRSTHRELERTNGELLALQRRRADLSSLIVHDLKSPLTTILGTAEIMLEDDQVAQRSKEDLRHIQQAARSMLRMALDLLDVGMGEDGALLPRWELVDVAELVSEVESAMSFRANERQQKIKVSVAEVLVPTWQLDGELLRRVLQNLVDNCVKYGPPGGVIFVSAANTPDVLEIRVRDQGPGVPEELREKIFEKYARIERDTTGRHRESHGLGLRFCRLAVEAHGGRIWVEDNRPGAIFRVRLPRRTQSSE